MKKCSWTYKKMSCVGRSTRPSAYFQRGHCTLYTLYSPFFSFSLFPSASLPSRLRASCIILQSNCTRTNGRPGFVQHPGRVLAAPSDRPFKPFIFLATCTRMNPYLGVACLRVPTLSPS